jgi:hypothetical protein
LPSPAYDLLPESAAPDTAGGALPRPAGWGGVLTIVKCGATKISAVVKSN